MRKSRSVLICAALAVMSYGQTKVDLASQGRNIDFSSAVSTRPVVVNTTLPATCRLGELFFKNDAPPGKNLYGCVGTDTWALLGGEGGGLPSPVGMAGKTLVSDGTDAVWGAQAAGSGLAKTTAGNDATWSVDSAAVPFLTLNNAFLGDNSYAGRTSEVPSATQSLTATSQIAASATGIAVSAPSSITLTSTPTMSTGSDGQRVTVVNVGSNSITAQDEANLPGSGLCLIGDQNQTIPAKGAIQFTYNTAAGCWIQLGAIVSAGGGGAVSTVFGRAGDVAAQAGDYTAAQVGAVPDPGNNDDGILINNGSAWQARALPNCNSASQKLHYDVATNTFSCQVDSTGSGLPSPAGMNDKVLVSDGTTAVWGAQTAGAGLAKTVIGSDTTWSADSAAIPFLALNNAFLGDNAFVGSISPAPSATQALASGDAISVAGTSHKQIGAASAPITLTSTPTIADSSSNGHWIYLVNVGSYAITIQDEATLTNSNLCLIGDANQTIPPNGGAIMLSWNSTLSCWVQLGALTPGTGGGGISSINALTVSSQALVSGTSGTDFNISSAGSIHTFNLPDASVSARGAVTTGAQIFGGKKTFSPTATLAGINVGSVSGDPSTAANGDIWYNATLSKLRCRQNGATSDCLSAGGGSSKSPVIWAGYEAISAGGAPYFFPPTGSLADHSSENTRIVSWPTTGTFSDARIRLASGQGADAGMTCTLRVNDADTAISITIPPSAASGSVHTDPDSVSVTAGQNVVWKCVNSSASLSAYMSSVALSFQQ